VVARRGGHSAGLRRCAAPIVRVLVLEVTRVHRVPRYVEDRERGAHRNLVLRHAFHSVLAML